MTRGNSTWPAWIEFLGLQLGCVWLGSVALDISSEVQKRCFFKKSVKTAVPEDARLPRALVLTKLIEWYRFGVGDEKSFVCFFCSLDGQMFARFAWKLHQNCTEQTRHRRREKIGRGASRCGQFSAAGVSRFSTPFWRNFQTNRAMICPSTE